MSACFLLLNEGKKETSLKFSNMSKIYTFPLATICIRTAALMPQSISSFNHLLKNKTTNKYEK
jgi:hypothetical protein